MNTLTRLRDWVRRGSLPPVWYAPAVLALYHEGRPEFDERWKLSTTVYPVQALLAFPVLVNHPASTTVAWLIVQVAAGALLATWWVLQRRPESIVARGVRRRGGYAQMPASTAKQHPLHSGVTQWVLGEKLRAAETESFNSLLGEWEGTLGELVGAVRHL